MTNALQLNLFDPSPKDRLGEGETLLLDLGPHDAICLICRQRVFKLTGRVKGTKERRTLIVNFGGTYHQCGQVKEEEQSSERSGEIGKGDKRPYHGLRDWRCPGVRVSLGPLADRSMNLQNSSRFDRYENRTYNLLTESSYCGNVPLSGLLRRRESAGGQGSQPSSLR